MSEFANFEPASRDTYMLIMDSLANNQIYIWDENSFLGRLWWLKLVVNIVASVSHTAAVMERMANGADLVQLSDDISAALILWQASCLYIQVCANKKLIKNLIKNLDLKWRTDVQLRPEMIAIKHESVQSFYKSVSLFDKVLHIFCYVYLFSPLVYVSTCHLILRREVVFVTPFHVKLPFRYDDNFALYCLVYLIDCTILICVSNIVTLDLWLMNASMRDLRLLFIMLQDDLRNLVRPDEDVDMKIAEMKLKAIIPQHRDLLQLAENLSDAFGAVFLIHLAFFSGTMCFFGFAARYNLNTDTIKNLPALGIIIISLYACCSSGQYLSDASMEIANAAYFSEWQHMSQEYRKCILCIITRSQKAQYIKSTSFTDVSLTTFTKILNVTWSFLSLITKMYEE